VVDAVASKYLDGSLDGYGVFDHFGEFAPSALDGQGAKSGAEDRDWKGGPIADG